MRRSPRSEARRKHFHDADWYAARKRGSNHVNPRIHFGKPCVAGTRIPVQCVLELVREGISFTDIIRDYYPDLGAEDIRACIQYAIDVVAVEDIHLATTP